MGSRAGWCAVLSLVATLGLAGCSGGTSGGLCSSPSASTTPSPTATPSPARSSAGFTSETFTPAFTAVPPAVVTLDLENEHFVSWNSTESDDERIRVLQPVIYYPPSSTTSAPPPTDYAGYLSGLVANGVQLGDVTPVTVDGRQAIVGTVTTGAGLDGALGCWAADAPQDDPD